MSEISFNEIPANLRIPGVYVEFDPRLAGNPVIAFKMLLIGQKLAAGSVAQAVPTLITSNSEVTEGYFGRGSQLAEMIKAAKKAEPFVEMWAIALDENGAGANATGTLTITGPATSSGTLNLYIAGYRVQVGVTSGDTDATIAAAIAAAITLQTDLPVTASATLAVVTLTCRWKGETGNDIDVRFNYFGETTPAGVAVAIVAMAGGTANPDINTAIAAFGDEWWNWYVTPWTDTPNLLALENELDSRFGPLRQIGGRAFTAFRGNLAATAAFGNGRNNPHVTAMGTNISPTPPWIWAAVNGAVGAFNLTNDPARQLVSLELEGVLPAKIEDQWDDSERNTLLFDGIATHRVQRDGTVQIEAQISMYQVNSSNLQDDAYLYINTAETLERWRFLLRSRIAAQYPRHKLADDTVNVTRGQAIAQPKTVKPVILATYQEAIDNGWMQGYEGYKSTLTLQINGSNKSRLDVYENPDLVGQLRITAVHSEFR